MERRYQNIKGNTNRVMNFSGVPAECWLLAIQYVVFIMNCAALGSLSWRTPYTMLYGYNPDISMIYWFNFFDNIYVKRKELQGGGKFPSQSNEVVAKFVVFFFFENAGYKTTYKVLTENTKKIIYQSQIKLAKIDHKNASTLSHHRHARTLYQI